MKLWLDDFRNPKDHGYLDYVWVQTAEACIEHLRSGKVFKASLDHDLNVDQTLGKYEPGAATGYDVLCWLEEHPQYLPPGGIRVHSQNPVGRQRMEKLVERLYSK